MVPQLSRSMGIFLRSTGHVQCLLMKTFRDVSGRFELFGRMWPDIVHVSSFHFAAYVYSKKKKLGGAWHPGLRAGHVQFRAGTVSLVSFGESRGGQVQGTATVAPPLGPIPCHLCAIRPPPASATTTELATYVSKYLSACGSGPPLLSKFNRPQRSRPSWVAWVAPTPQTTAATRPQNCPWQATSDRV